MSSLFFRKYYLEIWAAGCLLCFALILLLQGLGYLSPYQILGEAWIGTDERAAEMALSTGYKPWARYLFEPSEEIASLLFSLQAAAGALVLGYFFGYYRGKKQGVR